MVTTARERPTPWVQVKRKVPDSSSRDNSGAPTKTPITTGTTCRAMTMAENRSVLFANQFSKVPHGV